MKSVTNSQTIRAMALHFSFYLFHFLNLFLLCYQFFTNLIEKFMVFLLFIIGVSVDQVKPFLFAEDEGYLGVDILAYINSV